MIKIDGIEYQFTNEMLETSYFIHNEKQVSIEVNGMVKLIEVDNAEEFVNKYFK